MFVFVSSGDGEFLLMTCKKKYNNKSDQRASSNRRKIKLQMKRLDAQREKEKVAKNDLRMKKK